MKVYSMLCGLFSISGFLYSLVFDPSTMSGDQLIARTVTCAGAAISFAILANASKTK